MLNAKVIGINALSRWAAKARQQIGNNERMFAQGVTYIDGWIQRNFKGEGSEVGGWQPLSPATIAGRRKGAKAGNSAKILQDTGRLRMNWRRTWTSRRGIIESGTPYASVHQEGGGNVPQRRLLPVADEIREPLARIFGDEVERVLRST